MNFDCLKVWADVPKCIDISVKAPKCICVSTSPCKKTSSCLYTENYTDDFIFEPRVRITVNLSCGQFQNDYSGGYSIYRIYDVLSAMGGSTMYVDVQTAIGYTTWNVSISGGINYYNSDYYNSEAGLHLDINIDSDGNVGLVASNF